MTILVRGEELALLPERAIYWAAERTLLVADLHLGKAATFRALGAPVPETPTYETLERLSCLVEKVAPQRIAFLGDLLHDREAATGAPRDALLDWCGRHPGVELELIVGNHDRRAMSRLDEAVLCAISLADERSAGPFVYAHHPPVGQPEGYVLCGHIHPGFRLTARGRRTATLPCFWFQHKCAVLPAFGEFTGLALVDPGDDDELFLCAASEVIRLPSRN